MALLKLRSLADLGKWGFLLGLSVGAAPLGAGPTPPSGVVSQRTIYAAFVVNITRFIQWPDTLFHAPGDPIVIGSFSHDGLNDELDAAVRGESVGTHPLRTLRIRSLDDLAACQVIFMEGGDPRQHIVLSRIAGKPILSISDGEGFLKLGGHVCFVPRPPRTQLRISLPNLRESGLQARSQLLRLAQTEGP